MITAHKGFRKAIADAGFTASQAVAFISIVEAAEGFLLGCVQCRTDENQAPQPLPQPQEPDPTSSGRPWALECASSAVPKGLLGLSESLASQPSPFGHSADLGALNLRLQSGSVEP